MLYYKTDEEVELLRESNLLVSKTLAEIAGHVQPGVTTLYLDNIAETFIRDHHAVPAFKGYGGFPNCLCTSVNEEVVHGIPSDYVLKEGDIISVDCGVILNGWYGDSAYTFPVGQISGEVRRLIEYTRASLEEGVKGADIVVMVHPDHQYDATVIPHLIQPIIEVRADAAFGSRMLGGRPLDGGMPRWKYYANIFLTSLVPVLS